MVLLSHLVFLRGYNFYMNERSSRMPLWAIILLAAAIPVAVALVLAVTASWVTGEKTYACPNCGHRFSVARYDFEKYWYSRTAISLERINRMGKSARLECPKCKITDICTAPYDR
jgi:hypothetical protein